LSAAFGIKDIKQFFHVRWFKGHPLHLFTISHQATIAHKHLVHVSSES
jgi:hypothetical protein